MANPPAPSPPPSPQGPVALGPRTLTTILIAVFVVTSLVHIWRAADQGVLTAPPHWDWDEWDYENIAFNLSIGAGFASDYSSVEFRRPYEEQQQSVYDPLLRVETGHYLTTFRAPGFPLVTSLLYRVFGRAFWPTRVLNALALGGAAAIAAFIAYQVGGLLALLFAWGAALVDPNLAFYAAHLLTEPLALFVIAVLLYQLTAGPSSLLGRWPCLALTCAVLVSLRSILVLWIPFILFAWYRTSRGRPTIRQTLAAAVLCTVFLLPWGYRNSSVLQSFAPFGSQGGINLLVDYSDQMMRSRGIWKLSDQTEILAAHGVTGPWTAELQQRANALGTPLARAWLRDHIDQLPALLMMKISSLWWRDATGPQLVFAILTLIALPFLPKPIRHVFLLLLVANTCAVALTHNVINGRFLLPLHPLFHIGCATALSTIFHALQRRNSASIACRKTAQ